MPDSGYIIDADGEMVWFFPGPINTCRAQMDYEGNTMWMITCNPINEFGELRSVSMDGAQVSMNVPGFDGAHHDLTVMPGGKVAALVWSTPANEPPSDLVIRTPDGQTTTAFTVGSNLYQSDIFHANAVHYIPSDDSFTISDRNPNVVVKVSAAGVPLWQLGGVCDGAPTGTHCSPQSWLVNHGHHLLDDGTLLVFNNTETTDAAHVLEFQLDDTASGLEATLARDYTGTGCQRHAGRRAASPGRQHANHLLGGRPDRRARPELERRADLHGARRLFQLAPDALRSSPPPVSAEWRTERDLLQGRGRPVDRGSPGRD